MIDIGGGSSWAGRAMAHPLFDPYGPPLSLACPLLSPILFITYYISAVLHSHSNVLTSTGIENGIVCCVSVQTTHVDGLISCVHGP